MIKGKITEWYDESPEHDKKMENFRNDIEKAIGRFEANATKIEEKFILKIVNFVLFCIATDPDILQKDNCSGCLWSLESDGLHIDCFGEAKIIIPWGRIGIWDRPSTILEAVKTKAWYQFMSDEEYDNDIANRGSK